MSTDEEIIAMIIDRYGTTIDLTEDPAVMIDILRTFVADDGDGGQPCGGVPRPPPPACMAEQPLELAEVMRQLISLSRDVALIKRALKIEE